MTRWLRSGALLAVAAAAVLLGGCEAIFTYSPVSALQRPASSLSPEARLTYAQDALASGDKDAMAEAWAALKDDTGSEAVYTTALLGIELSGVPDLLLSVATDPAGVSAALGAVDIPTFIADHGLDPSYLVDAAARLQSVDASVELSPTDYAMGALGILLSGTGGTWDVTASSKVAEATSFFDNAVTGAASLPADDPLRQFVDGFSAYIATL